MRRSAIIAIVLVLGATPAWAQEPCRVLCTPEFKVEPTITFSQLSGAPRVMLDDGSISREPRKTAFEVMLSLGLPTRASWLELTIESTCRSR